MRIDLNTKEYIEWAKTTIRLAHACSGEKLTDKQCEDIVFSFINEFPQETLRKNFREVTMRVLQFSGELSYK